MKKRDIINTYGESSFDGRTIGLIGIGFVQFFAALLMLVIGTAALLFLTELGAQLFAGNTDIVGEAQNAIESDLPMLIIGILIFLFCFFFGIAWSQCIGTRWVIRHTIINGYRLDFDGKTIQLLGNQIKWFLLTVITAGIFSIWIPVKRKKWEVKHTFFEEQPDIPMGNGYNGNGGFIAPPVYIQTSNSNGLGGKCPQNTMMPYTPYTFGNSCPYSQDKKNK